MFQCEVCLRVSKPREKPLRRVEERRDKVYLDEFNRPIGHGWEIKKEVMHCTICQLEPNDE